MVTVEIRAPRDADGLRRALADHGIPAVITYLPELRACAPGRYAEVERATSGMSVSVGADALEVTIPPGTVRDGETFVLVRSVLPLSGTDVPVEGFYRERRRDSRARPWPRACRRPWEVDAEGAGRRRVDVFGGGSGIAEREEPCPCGVGSSRSGWCGCRRCPTLPRSPERSTIGAGGLSFRVRNGTGRFPTAMTTDTRVDLCSLVFPHPGVGGAGGVCWSGTVQWTRSCVCSLGC